MRLLPALFIAISLTSPAPSRWMLPKVEQSRWDALLNQFVNVRRCNTPGCHPREILDVGGRKTREQLRPVARNSPNKRDPRYFRRGLVHEKGDDEIAGGDPFGRKGETAEEGDCGSP